MAIAEQAAEWFVANREGLTDAVQRDTFATWLKTSPVHVEEYLGVALVARDLRRAAEPDTPLEVLLERARSAGNGNVHAIDAGTFGSMERAPGQRWTLAAAAAAAVLAAAGLALLWWSGDRTSVARYATRHGEQASERLPDNTVLRLNTDTAVRVRYSRRERLVEIERGEVLFEVAGEPGRAFRVTAGFAETYALGTKFDVYRKLDATVVTVVEGRVAVGLAPDRPGASTSAGRMVSVHAGEQIQVTQGRLPAAAAPVETQRSTAWLRREIVFEQEPLANVAAEFNRYSTTPIEIEPPALRALPISGVFSADDTESFVAFLRSLEGVRVEVTPSRIRVTHH
jgi:transmembrane sensor